MTQAKFATSGKTSKPAVPVIRNPPVGASAVGASGQQVSIPLFSLTYLIAGMFFKTRPLTKSEMQSKVLAMSAIGIDVVVCAL